jgi:AraC-like DNA-binding protein
MEDPQKRLMLNLLAYLAQRDISPEQLARLSGNATGLLTAKQLEDLWRNAVHLTGDPLLGLHFGESLQVAALGMVGQLLQTCSSIGEAFTQAAAFTHRITNLFTLEVTRSNPTFTICFLPERTREKESPFVFRQMMDLFMAFTLHEADGLVLEKIKPLTIILPYQADELGEYERVLRGKPVIRQGEYALEFEGRHWEEPILTANYELQRLLLEQVSATSDSPQSTPAWHNRIYRFLQTNAYLGIPTLEAIAANFNTSPRTLQRKLHEEGVTYQQLTDQVRKSLALHYIESGKYPIKEISYILGYNELSAFSRAFKRWTGTAPVHYQGG